MRRSAFRENTVLWNKCLRTFPIPINLQIGFDFPASRTPWSMPRTEPDNLIQYIRTLPLHSRISHCTSAPFFVCDLLQSATVLRYLALDFIFCLLKIATVCDFITDRICCRRDRPSAVYCLLKPPFLALSSFSRRAAKPYSSTVDSRQSQHSTATST